MASQGPTSVGAGTYIAGALANWDTPENIVASDDIRATVNSVAQSDFLAGTMAANAFTVPVGATIDGITVEVEASVGTAGTLDEVFLTKDGTNAVGNDGIAATQALTATDTYYPAGGAADLWGTTWSVAEVNASTFGALVRCTRVTGACRVDHVRITVHYTPLGGGIMRQMMSHHGGL